ncbi:MAG: GspH/FimT family pseudopilin [Desulfohalobiaceae bacterium]
MSLRSASGLTLLEMVMVMAILSIIVAIGVPSLSGLTKNSRLTSQANEFIATLHLARSEALKRGEQVVVCRSADLESCASNGDWDQGWIVFVDFDEDKARSSDEELLRTKEALKGRSTLIGGENLKEKVIFLPNGASNQNGGITLCNDQDGLKMLIIRSGRVRTEEVGCS